MMTQKDLKDLATVSQYFGDSISVSKNRIEIMENFIQKLDSEKTGDENTIFSKVSKSMKNAMVTFEDGTFKACLSCGLNEIDDTLSSILAPIGIYHATVFREKALLSLLIKTVYNFYGSGRDIQDAFALRIIINSDTMPESQLEKICYSIENICTSHVNESLNAHPIPCDKKIGLTPYSKDYIGFPKSNGYKSLHVSYAMANSHNKNYSSQKFEIQIRTQQMEDIALKIAVHQKYKEKKYKSVWEALDVNKLLEISNARFLEVGEIPGLIDPIVHASI